MIEQLACYNGIKKNHRRIGQEREASKTQYGGGKKDERMGLDGVKRE